MKSLGSNPYERSQDLRNKEPLDLSIEGFKVKCRHGPTFPLKQYHRPHRLNGRVRNGNGCCPVGMGTDKSFTSTIHRDGGVLLFDNQYQVHRNPTWTCGASYPVTSLF